MATVPKGRDEDGFKFSMAWLRHHDRYDGGAQLAAGYGFTDIDGSRPDVWRYERVVEEGGQNVNPNDFR